MTLLSYVQCVKDSSAAHCGTHTGADGADLEAHRSGMVWNMQPLSAPRNYVSSSSSSLLSNLYMCSVAFMNVRI